MGEGKAQRQRQVEKLFRYTGAEAGRRGSGRGAAPRSLNRTQAQDGVQRAKGLERWLNPLGPNKFVTPPRELREFGGLAQLVERVLSMDEVAGSIPSFSIFSPFVAPCPLFVFAWTPPSACTCTLHHARPLRHPPLRSLPHLSPHADADPCPLTADNRRLASPRPRLTFGNRSPMLTLL